MSSAIMPLFTFTEQCEWLRNFLERRPSLDLVDSHETDVYFAVQNLFESGEIRLAVTVAWLSLIRSSDPSADILVEVQHAIRNAVIYNRPGLVESCLEPRGRAGEGGSDAPP